MVQAYMRHIQVGGLERVLRSCCELLAACATASVLPAASHVGSCAYHVPGPARRCHPQRIVRVQHATRHLPKLQANTELAVREMLCCSWLCTHDRWPASPHLQANAELAVREMLFAHDFAPMATGLLRFTFTCRPTPSWRCGKCWWPSRRSRACPR